MCDLAASSIALALEKCFLVKMVLEGKLFYALLENYVFQVCMIVGYFLGPSNRPMMLVNWKALGFNVASYGSAMRSRGSGMFIHQELNSYSRYVSMWD